MKMKVLNYSLIFISFYCQKGFILKVIFDNKNKKKFSYNVQEIDQLMQITTTQSNNLKFHFSEKIKIS